MLVASRDRPVRGSRHRRSTDTTRPRARSPARSRCRSASCARAPPCAPATPGGRGAPGASRPARRAAAIAGERSRSVWLPIVGLDLDRVGAGRAPARRGRAPSRLTRTRARVGQVPHAEARRLAARARGRGVALQLEDAARGVVPGDREAELRVVDVGHGRRRELLAIGLVEGAPPVALALEQILQQVERALLAARIGLAVPEEVAELVLVAAALRVEEARVLDASRASCARRRSVVWSPYSRASR